MAAAETSAPDYGESLNKSYEAGYYFGEMHKGY